MRRMHTGSVALLVVAAALWIAPPPPAFAVSSCVPNCSSPPTRPSCSQPTVTWPDGCGGTCTLKLSSDPCQVSSLASCANLTVASTTLNCRQSCWYSYPRGKCIASSSLKCGTTGPGYYKNCPAIACVASGGACAALPSSWQPYGFVDPGDPVYGFPNVLNAAGNPLYPDPSQQDLLGLAAKGNIVLGNYTSAVFVDNVLPSLNAYAQGYAVDPTDADLGYHTGSSGVMYDAQGRPLFDGNYNQQDKNGTLPGTKRDGTPRKFYESTLSDVEIQALSTRYGSASGVMNIDGVLFTNHMVTGVIPTLSIKGGMVSRDDGLMVSSSLGLHHDIRLIGAQASSQIALPMSMGRPALQSVVECPPSGCL